MIERTCVRVILIDKDDRVLLLGARNPEDGRVVWVFPGGGVEEGESFEEAIRRELREELQLEPPPSLKGPVWWRKHHFKWDARDILQHEWFFVGRVDEPIATETICIPGQEGTYAVGARWLDIDQIKTWPDIVAPRQLADLLPPLLLGKLPSEPIDTGI